MRVASANDAETRGPPEISPLGGSPLTGAVQKPLRILLVDDHPILRAGLRTLLSVQRDFDVVAEAESAENALLLARTLQPALILLDFSLPGMNGADAARALKRDAPLVRVLALSVHDEVGIVRRVLDSGADGYLLKRSACDELVRAVRQVAQGETYLDPALSPLPGKSSPRRSSQPGLKVEVLSERETEVSQLLAHGLTMKEIAQQLSLSPRTLETYRSRAMEKLALRSRADLIRYAIRRGWLSGSD
jgi:DNA-binding NarL/FixJ family response regulator